MYRLKSVTGSYSNILLIIGSGIVALVAVLLLRSGVPGFQLAIQPLKSGNAAQNVWVTNIGTDSAPATDWQRIKLGNGWVKAPDAHLPSGAAALTSDPSSDPIIYRIDENEARVSLATGPDFGAVRILVNGTARDIDLQASTQSVVVETFSRPFFSLQALSQREVALILLIWLALTLLLASMFLPGQKTGIGLLTASSAVFLVTWAMYIPTYEGPDEVHHWEYSRYLHENKRLPRISPELAEANSPPLYYALLAPIAVDVETPKPLPVEERIRFASYEHTDDEFIRYAPLYIARLITVLLSLGAVIATYYIAIEISSSRNIAIFAAGIIGTLPQFTFRGMNISNDSLVTLFAAWSIYGMVRIINRGFSTRVAVITGVFIAGAYLSKINAIYLLGIFPLALLIPDGRLVERLRRLILLLVPMILISPWLLFNIVEYGDPFARVAMREAVAHIVVIKPITSPYFTTVFPELLSKSFIGVFGWMSIYLPQWMYSWYTAFGVAAVFGSISSLLLTKWTYRWMIILLWLAFAGVVFITAYINLSFDQAQGRYLFPAIAAIGALWALGIGRIVGERRSIYAAILFAIALSNAYALLYLIYPIYYS